MKPAKTRDRNQLYMCTGESFRHNAQIGDCGDTRTLMEWLLRFYPDKDEEELNRFFDESYTNTDICKYVHGSVGKRLEAV